MVRVPVLALVPVPVLVLLALMLALVLALALAPLTTNFHVVFVMVTLLRHSSSVRPSAWRLALAPTPHALCYSRKTRSSTLPLGCVAECGESHTMSTCCCAAACKVWLDGRV